MSLKETIKEIVGELTEREKRQDELVQRTRFVVRDCANAIKEIHAGNLKKAREAAARLDKEIRELKKIDAGLEHITTQCYQEYAEIKCLIALLERKPLPTPRELGIDGVAFLNGLADCVGELRRALQVSLKEGGARGKRDANYFFEKMSELYDELMAIKFSASLVGGLRRKVDVLRGQLEQARSEILRSK